jgi:hypothetical protein
VVQTWAQAHLSPTSTGVILTTEPVFAGVVGVAVAGEPFGLRAAVGAACVVAAMLLTVLRSASRSRSRGGVECADGSRPGGVPRQRGAEYGMGAATEAGEPPVGPRPTRAERLPEPAGPSR